MLVKNKCGRVYAKETCGDFDAPISYGSSGGYVTNKQ